jgi:quercetin dioxygenase-like cupin family protein
MEVCVGGSYGRVLVVAAAALTLAGSAVAQQNAPGRVPPTLFSGPLAEAPGHSLVVVELNFPPNAAAPSTSERHPLGHRHPGSVYVYVTQGAVRLGIEGQPVQVVRAGEIFFEPVGAHHIVSENASTTEPARALAFMIVPEGQPLTTRDKE